MIYKIFLLIMLVLLFGGCGGINSTPKPSSPNKKAFVEEDTYILFALRAEELKDYESASELFNILYKKSSKKEYLYRSLKNTLSARKYKKVITNIDNITNNKLNDAKLIRFKIFALLGEQKLNDAKALAIKLVEITKSPNDYILVAEIYVKQKKFNTALKYLESAYVKEYNELILDKMSIILYINLERTKDAIAQLETHTRVHGCSKLICNRLIGFYSNDNNINGLLSITLRIYELDKSDAMAKKIIQIYTYKKEYIKLMQFLEKNKIDDDLLLQVYITTKNYKKAAKLAKKLYKDSNDIYYLGQSAIFEYESFKNKNNKDMQNRVIKKLKKVVKIEKNPLYLNYLGYLLIDHSIDIKAGIKYVREALTFNEDSAFYLDSLAWGYYKLGKCKKAFKIISKLRDLDGGDDPEVIKHFKIIKKCKINKGKNKK